MFDACLQANVRTTLTSRSDGRRTSAAPWTRFQTCARWSRWDRRAAKIRTKSTSFSTAASRRAEASLKVRLLYNTYLLFMWCSVWRCDNYNLKSHRQCNNISRVNSSGYVGHVTVYSWMFTNSCCLAVGLGLGLWLGLDIMIGWKVVLHTYFCDFRL